MGPVMPEASGTGGDGGADGPVLQALTIAATAVVKIFSSRKRRGGVSSMACLALKALEGADFCTRQGAGFECVMLRFAMACLWRRHCLFFPLLHF